MAIANKRTGGVARPAPFFWNIFRRKIIWASYIISCGLKSGLSRAYELNKITIQPIPATLSAHAMELHITRYT